MNKLLWEKSVGMKIDSIKVGDENITLNLEGGEKLEFSTYHSQECCESVYGDFSVCKYHEKELIGKHLSNVKVKKVEDMGFLLCFDFGYEASKIFIACYNFQNGYYSSNLELTVNDNGTKTTVDISDCVEDHID